MFFKRNIYVSLKISVTFEARRCLIYISTDVAIKIFSQFQFWWYLSGLGSWYTFRCLVRSNQLLQTFSTVFTYQMIVVKKWLTDGQICIWQIIAHIRGRQVVMCLGWYHHLPWLLSVLSQVFVLSCNKIHYTPSFFTYFYHISPFPNWGHHMMIVTFFLQKKVSSLGSFFFFFLI